MRELTNRWAWEIGNGSEQRVVISKWWTLNAFRRRVAFGVGVVDSRLLYTYCVRVRGDLLCKCTMLRALRSHFMQGDAEVV